MIGHWVRNNIGLLSGDRDGSIINKILDSVFETDATVGMMANHLVIGTVDIRVMIAG